MTSCPQTTNNCSALLANDAYFGLMGTLDVAERTDLLEEELSVRQSDNQPILQLPDRLLMEK